MPSLKEILSEYCPLDTYEALFREIERYDFLFKVSKHRVTKWGDFKVRCDQSRLPEVTVNGSLNKYSFLFTFLHELAHLHTFKEHGPKVKPHGDQWKVNFQDLLLLAIRYNLFPDNVLEELLKFIASPKASVSASPSLMKALAVFDQTNSEAIVYLEDLANGLYFEFRARRFRKIRKKRTRVLCQALDNGSNYLISASAEIKLY